MDRGVHWGICIISHGLVLCFVLELANAFMMIMLCIGGGGCGVWGGEDDDNNDNDSNFGRAGFGKSGCREGEF